MTETTQLVPMDPPPLPATDTGIVVDFLHAHIQRKRGQVVSWEVLYEAYSDWYADCPEDSKPLSAGEFGAALAHVCKRADIRVKKTRKRVFCVDVRLIDPSVKALAGPTNNNPPSP